MAASGAGVAVGAQQLVTSASGGAVLPGSFLPLKACASVLQPRRAPPAATYGEEVPTLEEAVELAKLVTLMDLHMVVMEYLLT